jgi:hypothetical protein
METRQLIRMLIGAVAVTLVVIGIAVLMPGKVQADEVKKPAITTVVAEKMTAAKNWAIMFGADFKQQQIKNMDTTKEALHKDWNWESGRFTRPIKNAWDGAKAQVKKDSATVAGYWQSIATALGSLTPKKEKN